jgi:hypothetical protein
VSSLSTINKKIIISREDLARFSKFRHPDQASIGEAHLLINVLAQQTEYVRTMILHHKIHSYDPALQQPKDGVGVHSAGMQQEYGLRQNCFASPQRIVKSAPTCYGLFVKPILAIQIANQRSRRTLVAAIDLQFPDGHVFWPGH